MRRPTLATLALLAMGLAAAPISPDPPSGGELEQASFRVPSQIVNGWYERGDAEGEAENLEAFLRTLTWGTSLDDQERAMESGRSIEVSVGQVDVRETPENVDRIGDAIDPGLEPFLRQRILATTVESDQSARGISSLPADAGSGIIRTRPRETSTGSSSLSGGRYTRHILNGIDASIRRGDLRVTLIDVYLNDDVNRLEAVLLCQSSQSDTELELLENRRATFENWQIRFVEGSLEDREIRVVLEIAEL